ncbi:MAG: protein-tyrosine phosphatase family protein [Actinomycetes bacterium]|jgi:protein-tyrosine phosphatase|nr:dual specificity protein phosphatase [Actinomycetes bacterium]
MAEPAWLSWIGEERIAVGRHPTAESMPLLSQEGITHIVNCCARVQTWLARDLSAERRVFGRSHVIGAPMWDLGRSQPPRLWSPAVWFAIEALDEAPTARVLIHCRAGRRRSVLVTYAVLRLRGYPPDDAAALILSHRPIAQIVPAYQASVEKWLASGAGRQAGSY